LPKASRALNDELGGNIETEKEMKRSANHHAERCREMAEILIVPLREVARRHGYALGVHGSLSYDIDLIACPWRDLCTSPESLADAINAAVAAIAGQSKMEGPEQKPCGRLAWSFHMGGGPYVDLSVMPPNAELRGRPLADGPA
jgi:hypothetical protein